MTRQLITFDRISLTVMTQKSPWSWIDAGSQQAAIGDCSTRVMTSALEGCHTGPVLMTVRVHHLRKPDVVRDTYPRAVWAGLTVMANAGRAGNWRRFRQKGEASSAGCRQRNDVTSRHPASSRRRWRGLQQQRTQTAMGHVPLHSTSVSHRSQSSVSGMTRPLL